MTADPIAARYARVLFDAAKAQHALRETLNTVEWLQHLIETQPALQQFLRNPDVDPEDKVGVLDRTFHRSWSELVRAFVRMVVGMGRAEALSPIVDALRQAVDEDEGRLQVTVRSARPLSEATLNRLRTRLEHRERKQIALMTEVDPALIGGLQVLLDHRLIDGSIRTTLTELKQRLQGVKVD